MSIKNILASDIGGTNGRFAHFSYDTQSKELILVQSIWLPIKSNAESAGEKFNISGLFNQLNFSIAVDEFDIFSFALASPIIGRKLQFHNSPLVIDLDELEHRFKGKPIKLLNDFVAQAYAVLSPLGTSYLTIRDGIENSNAPLAIMGAGTGFGKAFIVRVPADIVMASEGGHAAFAPQSKREADFAEFVRTRLNVPYAIYDNTVSGIGLSLLHEFLTGEKLMPQQVAEGFSSGKYEETLTWFAGFYGRAARNYTLEILALGGVFISGGIAIKNPKIITHEAFLANYTDTAIRHNFLKDVPIKLMNSEDNGLWGAAEFGVRSL